MLIRRNLSVFRNGVRWPPIFVRWLTVAETKCPEEPSTSSASSAFPLKRIDLVPARIHAHLFAGTPIPETALAGDPFEKLQLPDLEGANLLEHFENIASRQFEPYRCLLAQAASLKRLPRLPDEWAFQTGWTRYSDNEPPTQVKFFSFFSV
ncbi:unnamed protein product [Gongylonema pulchrum]|uniref:DNApol_Exo domain-containing protein n=1 Tax=Gongylonema pulchrum TaxID=637853 RepID=A0A183ENV0_9BILA|nr:unnamed protein product [Gongylonema pulchrum]